MAGLGVYHYGARFYSPKLGRFLSADTIVPGYANPQNLNRYSYVNNSPLMYTDPTGHQRVDPGDEDGSDSKTIELPIKDDDDDPDTPTALDVENSLRDKAKEIDERNSLWGGLIVGTSVGTPLAFITCPESGLLIPCILAVEFIANALGVIIYGIIEPVFSTDVDALNSVADTLDHAIQNPRTGDSITLNLTFEPENGSLVQYNVQDQYLEMNPYYHPDQYVLQIEGESPIILTPDQAFFVNDIVGGGLIQ